MSMFVRVGAVLLLALSLCAVGQEAPKSGETTPCAPKTPGYIEFACADIVVPPPQKNGSGAAVSNDEQKALSRILAINQRTILMAQYLTDKDRRHANLLKLVLETKKLADKLCEQFKCEAKAAK